jgi:adenylosuccinate synthase
MPVFDFVQNRFEKYILRLIPSDILRKGKLCVIGNGVVVDPIALLGGNHVQPMPMTRAYTTRPWKCQTFGVRF